eukprot:scaffold25215_cov52-Attheya_sp.AAC.2
MQLGSSRLEKVQGCLAPALSLATIAPATPTEMANMHKSEVVYEDVHIRHYGWRGRSGCC